MEKISQKPVQRNRNNPLSSKKLTQIVQGLLKCGQFLQREMNQVCERFGLKQQQFNLLNAIVWYGPISQKELGETLLFEKSNVSKIVKILLEKKWIRVAVAARDGRLTLLTKRRRVSPSGKNACWPLINQAQHCYRSYQKTSRPTPLDC